MRRFMIPGLLHLATALPAAAQESGGLSITPQALAVGGPRGLARPLPFTFPGISASDLQVTPTPAERRQRHQDMIARLRGDGGFLDGFSFGQPRAASRQRPVPAPEPDFVPVIIDQRTKVVNRFEAPVAITNGNNNVVQQQGASGSGPTAQQQVATVGRRGRRSGSVEGAGGTSGGGAVNVVTADGNIVQGTSAR